MVLLHRFPRIRDQAVFVLETEIAVEHPGMKIGKVLRLIVADKDSPMIQPPSASHEGAHADEKETEYREPGPGVCTCPILAAVHKPDTLAGQDRD